MLRRILIILTLGLLLLLPTTAFSMQTSDEVSTQISGTELYAGHCASCHRSLSKPSKPQRSISRLRSSIRQLPAMNNLAFLTDEQLAAISTELKKIPLN
jgi:mono/diheme cytochrome c family protein